MTKSLPISIGMETFLKLMSEQQSLSGGTRYMSRNIYTYIYIYIYIWYIYVKKCINMSTPSQTPATRLIFGNISTYTVLP